MSVKIQITAIFLRFDNSNCQNNSDICQNIILDTITLSDLQYRIILFPFYNYEYQNMSGTCQNTNTITFSELL